MNFKKYHVSRNLLDMSTVENGKGIGMDGSIIDYAKRCSTVTPIDVSTYSNVTLSFTATLSTTRVIYALFNDSTLIIRQTAISSGSTIDVSSGNKLYICFYDTTDYKTVQKSDLSNVMLNTGSTALPYEPYSSEVWHDTPHYIHNTSTDTLTTLPAVLYPNDITATVGLKGNMSQNGTPTPSNPIQPSECGDKTANLIYNVNIEQGGWSASIGTVPTKIENPARCRYNYFFPVLSKNVLYDFKDLNVNIVMADANDISLGGSGFKTGTGSYTLLNDTAKITLIIANTDSTQAITPEDVRSKNISLDYGYKIPISSANTTTPVYLGEAQSTRRIKKLVFNGTENWVKSTTFLYLSGLSPSVSGSSCISTHYPYSSTGTANSCMVISNIIRIYDNAYATADDFKTFLASQYTNGTPVTVWYVLATPATGIVNEPLRKIGDYADTVSGITIPTIAGANSFDVLTTLKPSEVTVNYKGWHPVADVHERESGAWT